MAPNRRWWISWCQPGEDYRPVTWPLPPAVPAYWCSGYATDGATLCAVVDAPSEAKAKAAICTAWARRRASVAWRFCEEKPAEWHPPVDRFPFPWPEKKVPRAH